MFNNFHKKEKPFTGMSGFGGGFLRFKSASSGVKATGGTAVAAVKLINMFENKNIVGAGFIINLPELKGEEILNKMGIKTHSLMEF